MRVDLFYFEKKISNVIESGKSYCHEKDIFEFSLSVKKYENPYFDIVL